MQQPLQAPLTDSRSLWNGTISPGFIHFVAILLTRRISKDLFLWLLLDKGWTAEEAETLRKAVIYYGIGNWRDIVESGCLAKKTNAQLNLQLQRMLGQQSTAGKSFQRHYKVQIADEW